MVRTLFTQGQLTSKSLSYSIHLSAYCIFLIQPFCNFSDLYKIYSSPSSYYTVSLLLFAAKLLESCLSSLSQLLFSNSLLNALQSSILSITPAKLFIKVNNDFHIAKPNIQFVILVFLELSAAFDSLSLPPPQNNLSTWLLQHLAVFPPTSLVAHLFSVLFPPRLT